MALHTHRQQVSPFNVDVAGNGEQYDQGTARLGRIGILLNAYPVVKGGGLRRRIHDCGIPYRICRQPCNLGHSFGGERLYPFSQLIKTHAVCVDKRLVVDLLFYNDIDHGKGEGIGRSRP